MMKNYTHVIRPCDSTFAAVTQFEQLRLEVQRTVDVPTAGPGATSEVTTGGRDITNQALPNCDTRLGALYDRPIPSRRTGAVYNAFSYPTKIDPEAIATFIAAHTSPGDTVLDVFAGSGTTGVAARLCEKPTPEMRRRATELQLPVEWGPRHVVLHELSVIGSLLGHTLCNPPDPAAFEAAARRVIAATAHGYSWMYGAQDPSGMAGSIRHAIWSDVITCGFCGAEATYWDLAVERGPLRLHKIRDCLSCGRALKLADEPRVADVVLDDLAGEEVVQRRRVLAHVYGRTGKTTWNRAPVPADLALVERVLNEPVPTSVPTEYIRWGDLHRSGYHQGIERVHHFYTRRNLIALGALWEAIASEPEYLQDALRLLILSYNASHSTLMSRVVVKSGQSDFILTGAQSGVLYVSSLPVEKNVIEGVQRKIKTFRAALAVCHGGTGAIRVERKSSTSLDLPDNSIDYVFTDPPFGGFIPYSEINQINEAWLGSATDTSEEAIISPAQGKGVSEYGALMKRVFSEVSRVLKPNGAATVVFHSSQPDVWAALGDAVTSAGLAVERTSVLDKTQVSFKQVVAEGSTRGDAVFLLSRRDVDTAHEAAAEDLDDVITELRRRHGSGISPQHLYSRYVALCVEEARPVTSTAPAFYKRVGALGAVAP